MRQLRAAIKTCITDIARDLLDVSDVAAARADLPNPHHAVRVVLELLGDPDTRDSDLTDAIVEEMYAAGFTWDSSGPLPDSAPFRTGPAPVARGLLRLSDFVARRTGIPNPHQAVRCILAALDSDMGSGDLIDAVQSDLDGLGFTWPDPDDWGLCDCGVYWLTGGCEQSGQCADCAPKAVRV